MDHRPGQSGGGLLAWMARNRVAANLLMYSLLAGGVIVAMDIKQEVYPEYDLDFIDVSISYPGAGPEEIEEGIVVAVEEEIRGLDGIKQITATAHEGSASVAIELAEGADANKMPRDVKAAAADLAGSLRNYSGVTDVDDGFAQGKPQYDFEITPKGRSVGLTARELGRQIRHAFYGAEALRQQRGRNEVKVMVRLPEEQRRSLYHLEELLIRTPDGGEIPLSEAAKVTVGRAYTQIRRVDGKRVLNVTASVIPGQANENKVLASLQADYIPALLDRYPGLKRSFEGRDRDRREAMDALTLGLGFSVLAIYGLLAMLFRSYVQPILVMISIPLGITGALLGHIVMGYDLSIISIFGIIALCGVVVNGGLVLTVTANRYVEAGADPHAAALQAGIRRFRPIVLAALTTFFGLAPMIFETSIPARFLIPMAISLGFGILFSTLVILLLTPALYAIQYDVARLLGRRPKPKQAPTPPPDHPTPVPAK